MRFEEVSAPLEQRLWHVTTTLLQPLLERLHDTTGPCLCKGTEDHSVAARGCDDDAFALENLASLYLLAAIVVMVFDYWRVSSIVTRLLNSSASAVVTVDPFYKKQK